MKAFLLCVVFSSLLINSSKPSIPRGSLILNDHPKEVLRFIDDGYLDLREIRNTCNFLTDPNITIYKGDSIPRRKNAFVRHIKQLNNTLETAWETQTPVNDSLLEILYEIALFESSLKEKILASAHPNIGFDDQLSMWLNTQRSKSVFSVAIDNQINKTPTAKTSPFWHPADSAGALNKRFDQLAKLKKIKAKKKMVVVFDDFSYDGSAPKINTLDLDMDNGWVMKWGDEIHTDVAGSRIFAALGYDVDHPYYYGRDAAMLVFPKWQAVQTSADLINMIKQIYHVDLSPFISTIGVIDDAMINDDSTLLPYANCTYMTFIECALEARPDRVKRIGSFIPNNLHNDQRRALRGALLAHAWIGNWDTRESNTLLTQVHMGNYQYRISAVFSDLGTSMGVDLHLVPPDFKTGAVNNFGWEVLRTYGNRIYFNEPMNALLSPYKDAQYADLLWMANLIAQIDGVALRKMVDEANWPEPLATLYYYKLASRRENILNTFHIKDPHPIQYDIYYSVKENGEYLIENGLLMKEIQPADHPEHFLKHEGRMRNYGN